MFMRMMYQHDAKKKSKKYAANIFIDDTIVVHCEEQYTLNFVPTGIEAFVKELHANCEEQGYLRSDKPKVKFDLNLDNLKIMIADNNFEKLFEELMAAFQKMGSHALEWVNQMILLKGTYQEINTKTQLSLLREDEAVVQMATFRKNLIDFLTKLNAHFTA